MQDPNEKGLRKILNFGHTLGHAIESYFLESNDKTTLLHGEAIAIGMILEAHISAAQNLLPVKEYHQVKKVISSIYPKVLFSNDDIDNVIGLLIHDKKNDAGKVQFALLERIGHAVINKEAENYLIFSAFEDYQN